MEKKCHILLDIHKIMQIQFRHFLIILQTMLLTEGFTECIENGEKNAYHTGSRRLTVRGCAIRVEKVLRYSITTDNSA